MEYVVVFLTTQPLVDNLPLGAELSSIVAVLGFLWKISSILSSLQEKVAGVHENMVYIRDNHLPHIESEIKDIREQVVELIKGEGKDGRYQTRNRG
jgi:hypothetical protein